MNEEILKNISINLEEIRQYLSQIHTLVNNSFSENHDIQRELYLMRDEVEEVKDIINKNIKYIKDPIDDNYYFERSLIRGLSFKMKRIIEFRYGFGGGCAYTAEKVAEMTKMDLDEVKQLEKNAIQRFRVSDKCIECIKKIGNEELMEKVFGEPET